jgi:hypothetical protein
MRALSEAVGVDLASRTKRETRQWELAADDLLDVNATPVDVEQRCAAYRRIWPDAKLTPLAIVGHWGLLGSEVVAKTSGFDVWLEQAPQRFARDTAHEIIDEWSTLDDAERDRRHRLLDERFDAGQAERARREDAA